MKTYYKSNFPGFSDLSRVAEVKTEFMKACLFIGRLRRIEPSTIYAHRWPFGSSETSKAYLEAVRLVCDFHVIGNECLGFMIARSDLRKGVRFDMRRRRRRGFTLKQYKSWRAKL